MCDILAAISYSYGYHERPRKRVKINMTIPSRPAPPPPQRNNSTTPLRYTPTTDWDFCAFDSAPSSSSASNQVLTGNKSNFQSQQQQQQQQPNAKLKKPPPPRPPPPKLTIAPTAPLKKPGQPQSINILSSLFGHKRASAGSAANKSNGAGNSHQKSNHISSGPAPVRLPPPPTASTKVLGKAPNHAGSFEPGNSHYGSLFSTATNTALAASGTNADMQLISFDSPPSSPTFTQKSCSDCISVDSFSSDSNYSSPNNGNMSQAESGFEDDFVACANNNRQRAGSGVPWGDLVDPFDAGSISGRAAAAPSPVIYGSIPMASSSSMAAQIRTPLVNSKLQQSDFIDPLCNGQSAVPKVPTVSMPTIIKPPSAGSSSSDSQKSTPSHSAALRGINVTTATKQLSESNAVASALYGRNDYNVVPDTDPFDSLTSHPMPSMPPPPPPPATDTYSEEPYGIALYDFYGEADEDLSFKANEKIYLLKRLNEEWYMGRDKRGLEGIFPVNFIHVKVPLMNFPAEEQTENTAAASGGVTQVRALYNFTAETAEDLTIMENDMVTVLYQITPEWLYGEIDGRRGQFPANYIEYVPPNLPQMPTATS
uniref:SH3 domain-containing protein n=1 Tax=Anopheles farauti TaxID=69004 RepID=A0A182QYH1_9DIPT